MDNNLTKCIIGFFRKRYRGTISRYWTMSEQCGIVIYFFDLMVKIRNVLFSMFSLNHFYILWPHTIGARPSETGRPSNKQTALLV